MPKLKRILIMGGGTGGHVFPGLAIADYFRQKGIEVHWLGTLHGLESTVVPAAKFPIHYVSIRGLRGKGWRDLLRMPWRLSLALLQSIRIIRKLNPDCILGMGGFVSGPGGLACFLLRKKLIIHEQNAKSGLTNLYLAKWAKKILEGFPDTFPKSNRVVTTGNPVRKEISDLSKENIDHDDPQERPPRLLVFGGSLGAQAFNKNLPHAIAQLTPFSRPQIWHQTGKKECVETANLYQTLNIEAKVVPFIEAMDQAYRWADIVLCRAGALTIAELCAVGLGAILIPFPHAVDDHQTENARTMVENEAAFLLQQKDLTIETLAALLKKICDSKEKRLAMAKAAYKLRKIDATETICNICEEVCN